MDIFLALLVNVVYGFLFFLAFGVMFITVIVFCMAFWDKVGKRIFQRQ